MKRKSTRGLNMFFYEYLFRQIQNMFSPVLHLCISQVKNESEASWQAASWALRGILVHKMWWTQMCCFRERLMEPGMWCELPALGPFNAWESSESGIPSVAEMDQAEAPSPAALGFPTCLLTGLSETASLMAFVAPKAKCPTLLPHSQQEFGPLKSLFFPVWRLWTLPGLGSLGRRHISDWKRTLIRLLSEKGKTEESYTSCSKTVLQCSLHFPQVIFLSEKQNKWNYITVSEILLFFNMLVFDGS